MDKEIYGTNKYLILNALYYLLMGAFFVSVILEISDDKTIPDVLIVYFLSTALFVGTFVYEMRGVYTLKFGTVEKEKNEPLFYLGIWVMRILAIGLLVLSLYKTFFP